MLERSNPAAEPGEGQMGNVKSVMGGCCGDALPATEYPKGGGRAVVSRRTTFVSRAGEFRHER